MCSEPLPPSPAPPRLACAMQGGTIRVRNFEAIAFAGIKCSRSRGQAQVFSCSRGHRLGVGREGKVAQA